MKTFFKIVFSLLIIGFLFGVYQAGKEALNDQTSFQTPQETEGSTR